MKDGWPRGRRMLQTWLLTSEEMASLLLRELVLLYRGEFQMCDCNTEIWIISNIKIENQQAEGRTGMGVRGRAPSEGQRVKKTIELRGLIHQRPEWLNQMFWSWFVCFLIKMRVLDIWADVDTMAIGCCSKCSWRVLLEGSPRFITCLFLV